MSATYTTPTSTTMQPGQGATDSTPAHHVFPPTSRIPVPTRPFHLQVPGNYDTPPRREPMPFLPRGRTPFGGHVPARASRSSRTQRRRRAFDVSWDDRYSPSREQAENSPPISFMGPDNQSTNVPAQHMDPRDPVDMSEPVDMEFTQVYPDQPSRPYGPGDIPYAPMDPNDPSSVSRQHVDPWNVHLPPSNEQP